MYQLNPNLRSFWATRKPYKLLKGGRFCHALGSRVVMFDGSTRAVEDVSEGDLLMGPDSRPRKVLAVHAGTDDMYRVDQASGISYTVNAAHILSLRRAPNAPAGRKSASGKPLVRHDRGELIDMNVVEFMNTSKKFKQVYRGWKPEGIDFEEKTVSLDPYFLGLWLGDGSCDSATITTMDREIVEYLKEYADRLGMMVRVRPNARGNKSSNYAIINKVRHTPRAQGATENKIMAELRVYGVLTDTACATNGFIRTKVDKRIPRDFLINTRAVRLSTLAGLIDSDGTYERQKNTMSITSINRRLAEDIKYLVDSLGFKSSIRERATKCQTGAIGTAWVVAFSGALSRIPCLLHRKKADRDSSRGVGVSSLSVTPVGKGEYIGFTLDGDHLYLLEDFTVLHNSGKTHDAAGMAAFLARNYSLRFLCIRQFQNRISDSVYTVIKEKIETAGWQDEFDIGVSSIRHKRTGSEFLFYGMARNINDIKGTEGVDICWIEEGEGLTKEQWDVIDPTIRKEGAEIWVLWNPKLVTDFVQTKLPSLLGDSCIIRHINYDENPFLSEDARKKAERLKEADLDDYRHIYLGQPLSDSDSSIIKRSWILSAIDAHKTVKPSSGIWTGQKTLGYDVADDGNDKNATTGIDGSIIFDIDEWSGGEDELIESCMRVLATAKRIGANIIGYDSIGVGAGTGSMLNNAKWRSHFKFNAGAKVQDPKRHYKDTRIPNDEFFANLKAQAWWLLADRFRNTHLAVTKGESFPASEMISIDSSRIDKRVIEQLIDELSTPRKDFDNQSKVKVESKKDLSKRDVKSPNVADSIVIAASRGMLAKKSMLDVL